MIQTLTSSMRRAAWAALLLLAAVSFAHAAASCPVVKHPAPTEAQKALATGDFAKAESLFRADLTKTPADADALAGLVHALVCQQKTKEAAEVTKTALAAAPASGTLLTLRGELEFRQGEPWTAEQTAVAAYKADPCSPRTRLLYARVAQASSRNATAKQQFGLAHQFDPEDAEIRLAWIETLPLEQRVVEMESFLAGSTGEDAATTGLLKARAESWKKLASQPAHACKLAAGAAPAELKFVKLAGWGGKARALGLELGVGSGVARLDISTLEGGLTLYKSAAEKAGLKRLTENDKPAFPGAKPTYLAVADKIKVGNLEFHDCAVKVVDGSGPFDDGDGTVGLDVFGDFLENVDYPMRKLELAALPASPADAGYVPALFTDAGQGDGAASPHPVDRVIAPEMKDWPQIYRAGRSLLLPTAINGNLIKLFALSIGMPETSVDTEIARQVSKTFEKAGWDGKKATYAMEITLNFARFAQKVSSIPTMDFNLPSALAGTAISGGIGYNSFMQIDMHLDYRDGLVKFEYTPNRGFNNDPKNLDRMDVNSSFRP